MIDDENIMNIDTEWEDLCLKARELIERAEVEHPDNRHLAAAREALENHDLFGLDEQVGELRSLLGDVCQGCGLDAYQPGAMFCVRCGKADAADRWV